MERRNPVRDLFKSIDDRDVVGFLTCLSDDVLFRFGNAPPVYGQTVVGEVVRSFFGSIKALRHDVTETFEQPDIVICHGTVTYTRHDTSTLTVPFANILKLDNDRLIREYLIYVDVSELYTSA